MDGVEKGPKHAYQEKVAEICQNGMQGNNDQGKRDSLNRRRKFGEKREESESQGRSKLEADFASMDTREVL